MNKVIVMSGEKYGILTIIKEVKQRKGLREFLCECDCGNIFTTALKRLRNGGCKSCGCVGKSKLSKLRTKHGLSSHPLYHTYCSMIDRCYNVKNPRYNDYGSRGINVCDEWINSFRVFINDMGKKPKGNYSLDRTDNNGSYTPLNCQWNDKIGQANNTRDTVRLTFKGKCRNLLEWSKITGISRGNLYSRYRRGWSHKKILTKKVNKIKLYKYKGERLNLKQLSERYEIKYGTLKHRVLNMGLSIEAAIETKVIYGGTYGLR